MKISQPHLALMAIAVILGFPVIYMLVSITAQAFRTMGSALVNSTLQVANMTEGENNLVRVSVQLAKAGEQLLSILHSGPAVVAALLAAGILTASLSLRQS